MTERSRLPVIIDTDPGVDDTLAILLALASPELEVLAFVVSFGNTNVESSFINVLKIYEALSRHFERFPADRDRFSYYLPEERKPYLVKGPQSPLEGKLFNAENFHGRDGLGDISQRHPELTAGDHVGGSFHPHLRMSEKSGRDLAIELIKSRPPRTVTYIALGPLTNLALMMRQDPTVIREQLGRVVCMGGALDVPGNTNPVAEFNFFADPYAVRELLTPDNPRDGIPLERFLLLPLDITTPHQLPFPRYKAEVDPSFVSTAYPSKASDKPPLQHFTSAFLERTREIMLEYGNDAMELHDITAIWCAIENPPILHESGPVPAVRDGWQVERRMFQVERTGEVTRGMLVVDRRDSVDTYDYGQVKLEKPLLDPDAAQSSIPAPVQVEPPVTNAPIPSGVACVVKTPGPEALLKLMMSRIWATRSSP